jgi:hypothetical protein
VLPARVIAEQDSFLLPPDSSSSRKQTAKFVQQLLTLEAPLSPLSSRPERTRISYFASLATTTCAALLKESACRSSTPRVYTGNWGERSGEISVWMLFPGNVFYGGNAPRELQCAFTLESTDEWTISGQDRCGHGCRAGHWTSNSSCIRRRRGHGMGYRYQPGRPAHVGSGTSGDGLPATQCAQS